MRNGTSFDSNLHTYVRLLSLHSIALYEIGSSIGSHTQYSGVYSLSRRRLFFNTKYVVQNLGLRFSVSLRKRKYRYGYYLYTLHIYPYIDRYNRITHSTVAYKLSQSSVIFQRKVCSSTKIGVAFLSLRKIKNL